MPHEAPLIWSLREARLYILAAIEQAYGNPNRDEIETYLRRAFNEVEHAKARAKAATQ